MRSERGELTELWKRKQMDQAERCEPARDVADWVPSLLKSEVVHCRQSLAAAQRPDDGAISFISLSGMNGLDAQSSS